MSSPSTPCFPCGGPADLTRLHEALASPLRLNVVEPERTDFRVVDTFDGQLYRAGQALLAGADGYLLFEGLWPRAEGQRRIEPPLLISRLPPALRERLRAKPHRALLEGAALRLDGRTLAVLDDRSQAVARLKLLELEFEGRTLSLYQPLPVRGQVEAFDRLLDALVSMGLEPVKAGRLLPWLGCQPPAYRAKPTFPIQPDESCQHLARRLCRGMVTVARQNEVGIRADLDSEFLHDYRVSLRKVRSVISLFTDVFPAEETGRLKTELAELMRQTNRLRDLDVYLLERERYYGLLPDHLHPGLERMFRDFARERRGQQQRVACWLAGAVYQERICALQRFFRQQRLLPAASAERPAGELAAAQIWKRYRKLCKIAGEIDADTPDGRVHALRIQCKKLRYLMEFFAPLYPKKMLKRLIRSLKGLQDNLGRFNDYAVQQRSLRAYLAEKRVQGACDPLVADALAALLRELNQQQLQERARVMENFAAFHCDEIHQAFKGCFRDGG